MHRHRHRGHQRGVGQLTTVEQESRSTPAHSAITTSLTVTLNLFLTFLMSSSSTSAYAMVRLRVIASLNGVRGARNGAAIARPLRTRRTMSTTVDTVVGTTLASRSGRVAKLARPPHRQSHRIRFPWPLHRFRRRHVRFDAAQLRQQVAPPTPSTLA